MRNKYYKLVLRTAPGLSCKFFRSFEEISKIGKKKKKGRQWKDREWEEQMRVWSSRNRGGGLLGKRRTGKEEVHSLVWMPEVKSWTSGFGMIGTNYLLTIKTVKVDIKNTKMKRINRV